MSLWYFLVAERKKKEKKMVQKFEMGYCPLSMRLGAGLGVLGAGLGVQARRQQALGARGHGAGVRGRAQGAAGEACGRQGMDAQGRSAGAGARGRRSGGKARQERTAGRREAREAHGVGALPGRACARRLVSWAKLVHSAPGSVLTQFFGPGSTRYFS